MHVRVSQKIGLLRLKNQNQFKKERSRKYVQKLFAITREFVSCYIHDLYTTDKIVLNYCVCVVCLCLDKYGEFACIGTNIYI